MITKYSLDPWDDGRFLSGHRYDPDMDLWRHYDPLVIVAMIAGLHVLEGAEHSEVELKDDSIELTVWWEDEQA